MFRRLYDWMIRLARSRHALWYLFVLSAAESIFFPIPTDIMLAPAVMAQRGRWKLVAGVAVAGSISGAVIGYLIGFLFIDAVLPMIMSAGYGHAWEGANLFFEKHGFWSMFLASFTLLPFKVFTIAGGAALMPFVPFLLGSLVGRSLRFGAVAGLVAWIGPEFEKRALRYIDWIGWGFLLIAAVGLLVWRFG